MGSKTDKFRKSHEAILKILTDLHNLMDAEKLLKDVAPACKLVSKLCGTLTMHFAIEERTLFPMIERSKDSNVRSLGAKFHNNAEIKTTFNNYYSKWLLPKNVQGDIKGFINATKNFSEALKAKFENEHRNFYDVVDKSA